MLAGSEYKCERCKHAQSVVDDLQICLNQIVGGYDREIKRLSKELERARKSSGSGSAGLSDGSRPEHISYGNIPGFSEEMRHLGDCYMHGSEGHSKDTDRAYKYYEAAAVHGCSGSSLFVGKRYLDGPEPDDGKALFFLTVAAKDGSAEAAYRVGMMHYAGLAGAGGESEAVRWLEQAMAGGHVLARYQLATMYAQGDGMPEDRLKAHQLFQAWEEQCANEAQSQQDSVPISCNISSPRTHTDVNIEVEGSEQKNQSIREGAELRSQVDNVRQRIAKLSLQLQSPVSKPPR